MYGMVRTRSAIINIGDVCCDIKQLKNLFGINKSAVSECTVKLQKNCSSMASEDKAANQLLDYKKSLKVCNIKTVKGK